MTEQTTNKIQELFQDEAFLTKFTTLETFGELKAELAQNGVELSDAELGELGKGIKEGLSSTDELSAEQLGDVAGGVVLTPGQAWGIGTLIGNQINKIPAVQKAQEKGGQKLAETKIGYEIGKALNKIFK
ncbi:MAG: hypothetical protein LBT32_07345 [Peptococcaceae bacterium]|jgi:hypothetical protein|nr:hypothetical protein [Peptococcaceae bacterium]